jgi:hypothetical protein
MQREPVSFITIDRGDDLIVAYAIDLGEPGKVASLILLRTPKFELLLPLEERGVSVSHELYPVEDEKRELLKRIVVSADEVDVESTGRTYHLDVSRVEAEEQDEATSVLRKMRRYGGFDLVLR